MAGGAAGKGTAEVVNPKAQDELGSHNLATGVGAGGGAIAGATVGAVGGPIGMAAGAAVGAMAGGMAGKGTAGVVNPADEDHHWRNSYTSEPYYAADQSYDDYGPAYALGYNGRSRYNSNFESAESQLASDWNTTRGTSKLSWDQAKHATRAAWNRVERAIPGDSDRDGN
ncbi:MAG: hypothetical protein H7315_03715 [Herminiimonas sp.]|nr:hypothetical protein [Herminiimonas sp.]